MLASYALDLTKTFNRVYTNTVILSNDAEEQDKLALVDAYRITAKNSFKLLGIEIPCVM